MLQLYARLHTIDRKEWIGGFFSSSLFRITCGTQTDSIVPNISSSVAIFYPQFTLFTSIIQVIFFRHEIKKFLRIGFTLDRTKKCSLWIKILVENSISFFFHRKIAHAKAWILLENRLRKVADKKNCSSYHTKNRWWDKNFNATINPLAAGFFIWTNSC